MASANCGSNSRRGQTVANTIPTWGSVTAGAFFFIAASCAPQRSAPESPTSSDAAILATAGRHHPPSPAVACRLHSTVRWATASHSCAPVCPKPCQRGPGTGRSSTPPSREADAAPSRQQDPARCPARPRPAWRHTPPPWTPGSLPCSSGVSAPRRAAPPRRPPGPRLWGPRHQARPLRATSAPPPRGAVSGRALCPHPPFWGRFLSL